MISARAQITSARENSLSRVQITSACAKQPLARNSLSRKMFLRSLEFNFGTMGEGTKAGRAFL